MIVRGHEAADEQTFLCRSNLETFRLVNSISAWATSFLIGPEQSWNKMKNRLLDAGICFVFFLTVISFSLTR